MKKKIPAAVLAFGLSLMLFGGPAHGAASTYTTKDGDTFWKLAKQYGVTVNKLQEANPGVNPFNLYKGLKITIPSTAQATVKAAPASAKSVTADGKSYRVSKTLNIKATAYSSAASENGKWGAVDYFGNPLKLGTVAVDPDVIPLGTKLYITGYEHENLPAGGFVAKAADIGGAIKGNRIDIFIPGSQAEVRTFGIQNIEVQILK
ncbi:3D domain-containing protein [Paenibacillus thailandensis]|uniref:3D domain-containing protein n=1 Tax=Paenibacillus thailandensis TaxID=393250 RepID=A0ABW5QSE2_9BACL